MKLLGLIGEFVIFLIKLLSHLYTIFHRGYELTKQMLHIGYESFILISITSGFTGLVTAVQASYQTKGYIPNSLIGVLVGKSTMIELGPVLSGLVLSGKVGASIAAEIGTMKVSEQIDALETLAVDPIDYLYVPRFVAGALMTPLLTIYAIFVGIFSAFILSKFVYGLNAYSFFQNMRNFFLPSDLWGGLLKALFFGMIITSFACFFGSRTIGGAEGVGKATTDAVVYSSIFILITDFLVASLLFGGF